MDSPGIKAIVIPETLLGYFRGVGLRLNNFLAAARSPDSIISVADISFLVGANFSVSTINEISLNPVDDYAKSFCKSVSFGYDILHEIISDGSSYHKQFLLNDKASWNDYALMFCKIPSSIESSDYDKLSVVYDIVGYDGNTYFITPYPSLNNRAIIEGAEIEVPVLFKKTMKRLFSSMPFEVVVRTPVFKAYVNTLK